MIFKFYASFLIVLFVSCKNTSNKPPKSDKELNFNALIQKTKKYSVLGHDDYYVWGASMVEANGIYHLYYSRWPKEKAFKGWLPDSEIAYATATSPLGPYTYKKTILTGFGKGFWNEEAAHNPHIKRFNNKYYLYFISHHVKDYGLTPTRKNITYGQRIGVAVAASPEGPWKVSDAPLIDYQEGKAAHGYMVNPSVCQKPDGSYLMIFKSRPEGSEKTDHFTAIQCLATAPTPEGPFTINENAVLTEATAEDPYMWYQNGKYYAIADDQYGDYLKEDRGLVLFQSADGVNWDLAKNPLVSYPEINWVDGTTTKLKHLERPQIWFDKNGNPAVLFCAAMLLDNDLSFNVHIPLKEFN
ncbi:MAG: glycoside hydrolase family protein [Aestuariibaculum sp.]